MAEPGEEEPGSDDVVVSSVEVVTSLVEEVFSVLSTPHAKQLVSSRPVRRYEMFDLGCVITCLTPIGVG